MTAARRASPIRLFFDRAEKRWRRSRDKGYELRVPLRESADMVLLRPVQSRRYRFLLAAKS